MATKATKSVADAPVTVAMLMQFYREVMLPDLERVFANAFEAPERRLRDEMRAGFEVLASRLDRLLAERHDG